MKTVTVMLSKGCVVIPRWMREKLGLTPGTVLRVRVEENRIVLEPVATVTETTSADVE